MIILLLSYSIKCKGFNFLVGKMEYSKEGLIKKMVDRYFNEISDKNVRARWSRLMKAVEEKKTTIDKSIWLQASDCKLLKL